jgi:hypothetical protein
MSDMKTFTVRELDREPAKVLDAADRDGVVRIKRRDGRVYSVQREAVPQKIISLPDFAARRRAIFSKPLSRAQARLFDKLIRGE